MVHRNFVVSCLWFSGLTSPFKFGSLPVSAFALSLHHLFPQQSLPLSLSLSRMYRRCCSSSTCCLHLYSEGTFLSYPVNFDLFIMLLWMWSCFFKDKGVDFVSEFRSCIFFLKISLQNLFHFCGRKGKFLSRASNEVILFEKLREKN